MIRFDSNSNASLLSDHIRLYADALPQSHCQTLIKRFESSPAQEVRRADGGHSFTQIDITENWQNENGLLVPIFLAYFSKYQHALNARYWPSKFSFEHIRIKRYLSDGQDEFPPHVDVMCQAAARRFMTAIVYLNDVTGGETVFSDLGISIAPKAGLLLLFPPLWLFPHAGLPVKTGSKYILHTYMCYPN